MASSAVLQPSSTPQAHRTALASKPVLDRIWSASWHSIEDIELVPGFPLSCDKWVIPSNWASGGSLQGSSVRTINFGRALPSGWQREDPRSEAVLRRLKRLAALLLLSTLRFVRRVVAAPKPSTWVLNCQALLRASQNALELSRSHKTMKPSLCPDGSPIFQDLLPDQLEELKIRHPTFASAVVARLNALLDAGAFDDWPAKDVAITRSEGEGWRPLSDTFTAAVGHSALWMLEEIGPELIRCYTELRSIQTTINGSRRRADVSERRKEWLAAWQSPILHIGKSFKYQILCNISDYDDSSTVIVDTWPPKFPIFVRNMVGLLQAAHMIILALATGARDSEIASLTRKCLTEVRHQDLLIGYTYKLSDSAQGERRNWPLPKIAVQAIKQQERIAQMFEPDGTQLFVSFSARSEGPLRSLGAALRSYTRRIRLLDGKPLTALCDGTVHLHRFRMTVTRLAALSLVGANQILFDVLGHRDPEMTVTYILSDPALQDDMRQIAHEAALAIAKDAIQTVDENGGPAATHVRELKYRLTSRSAEHDLDVQSLELAAEILSQNGRVMLVKPGILCTKTFNQFGPCTRGVGSPDIGNCRVDCMHRLELAAARADHRKAIEQILVQMPDEDGMMRVWWQAQLLSHLMPFADLREEMLADLRVRQALTGVAQVSIDMLDERYRGSANNYASAS